VSLSGDAIPLHVALELFGIHLNVLLAEGVKKSVVAQLRMVFVQALDLCPNALVDRIVLA